eukprot:1095722-Prorocentrum_minimum.AAC.1
MFIIIVRHEPPALTRRREKRETENCRRGVLPQVGQPWVREGDLHQAERPQEPAGAARGEREVGGGVHAPQVGPRTQGQGARGDNNVTPAGVSACQA